MKKITLFAALCAISVMAFSQLPSCPRFYKRNNGNGGGCTNGKLTLLYDSCPSVSNLIDSVLINGVRYDVQFGAPSACSGQQNEVSYCILSGNMPPTGTWKIFFSNLTVLGGYNCIVNEGGNLPINLSSFYARRQTNNVVLSWVTAYEQNARAFEIERSSDGKEFFKISTVQASNKTNGSSYSFVDAFNGKNTVQYRLKMVDLDGSFKYSEVRIVKGSGSIADFTLFPNPSSGDAKVSVSDITEGTEVFVLDNSGRVIRNISMRNTNNISINGLQKGIYMIKIANKLTGETVTKKLTVIN